MNNKPKKKRFKVEDGETISSCLDRIAEEGYKPIKRMEKPVFKESSDGVEPAGREITFEATLVE